MDNLAYSQIQSQKHAAVQFMELVVAGLIDEAYQRYVDMGGIHHNPYFPAGFPALKKAMIEDQVQNPNKQLAIQNVLGDDDLVAVHSHLVPSPGQTGMLVVHLFRFQGGKIVELWDVGQLLPADSPNKDGAF